MTYGASNGDGQPPVTFTIDGAQFTVSDRRQTAAQLLALAGLEAGDHDLAKIVGQGNVEKRYDDADEVQLTPGARFISIFTGPTPVV